MWRRHRTDHAEIDAIRDAQEAAARAEARRLHVEAQWPIVNRIGGAVRDVLDRNHFGEQIQTAAARKATSP